MSKYYKCSNIFMDHCIYYFLLRFNVYFLGNSTYCSRKIKNANPSSQYEAQYDRIIKFSQYLLNGLSSPKSSSTVTYVVNAISRSLRMFLTKLIPLNPVRLLTVQFRNEQSDGCHIITHYIMVL